MEKLLTIGIPTYNRKQKLVRLLKSIEAQKCTDLYNIIISDNCSDYSVEEVINKEFSGDFRNVIKVKRRAINGGGAFNISSIFVFCETKLFWMIGDDDEMVPGAITTVLKNYENNPDIPFFKYVMKGTFMDSDSVRMKNVDDLVLCHKKGYLLGSIFFISTNIYNMELLKPYLSECLIYGYCCVSQILPMMHCLVDSKYDVLLCNDYVVQAFPADEDRWNYIKVVTSLSTVLDINWGDKHKEIKKLFRVICSYFGLGQFLIENIRIKDKSYRKYVYWKGMHTVFKSHKGILELFALSCYWLERLTRIKFLTGFYVALLNKQTEIQNKFREKAKTDAKAAKWFYFLKKHVSLLR